jgi:hypothetical protein
MDAVELFHSTLRRRGMSSSWGLKVATHHHLLPSCGAKPPLFHMSSWCGDNYAQGKCYLTFTLHHIPYDSNLQSLLQQPQPHITSFTMSYNLHLLTTDEKIKTCPNTILTITVKGKAIPITGCGGP